MFKLAWATDLHLNFVSAAVADAWCSSVEDLQADALVISGDIAEAPSLTGWLRFVEERTTTPIYFVTGNHDYYRGSMVKVREQLGLLHGSAPRLHWLDAVDVVQLTEHTGLVGHGGWADGRNGVRSLTRLLAPGRMLADTGPRASRSSRWSAAILAASAVTTGHVLQSAGSMSSGTYSPPVSPVPPRAPPDDGESNSTS